MSYKQKGLAYVITIALIAIFTITSGLCADFGYPATCLSFFLLSAGGVGLMAAIAECEVRP